MKPPTHKIIFETERLLIRQYTIDDFENFFLLSGNEDVMRYIRPVQDREQSKEFFNKIIKAYDEQPGLGRWAMLEKQSGIFLGSFAVIPIENSDDIQLGYALLKEHWGKGYATEATKGGIEYFQNRTSLTELYALTEPANTASEKVLRKAGFQFLKTKKEGEKELLVLILRKQ